MMASPAPKAAARKRVTGEPRRNALKPYIVQTCRTGYTRLVNVASFRTAYLELHNALMNERERDEKIPEYSVEDVKVESPFQAIERAINAEIIRVLQADEEEKKQAIQVVTNSQYHPANLPISTLVSMGGMPMGGPQVVMRMQPHIGSGQPVAPPAGFGTQIPTLQNLEEQLEPLRAKRREYFAKKGKKELNTMTEKTITYEIQQKLKIHNLMGKSEPLMPNEVVLRVAIFHPHNFTKTQEFLVLGSQPLTALKDEIYCLSDEELDGPHIPSSFFFIENKFYNDMRNPRAIKYSDPIITWVKQDERFTQPGLSHFETGNMADTTFNDLSVRLGSHYLMMHQGDCKHVIIFTELRMANELDEQNALVYPVKVFQCKTKRKKCRVCDLFSAKKVTYGDKLANENPFFWCEQCYRVYHYSVDGVLLYDDFQEYPYHHE